MATENKKTESVIPMADEANEKVLEFSKTEDAEADRIFYEAQGLQADGKTPLGDEVKPDPEVKPEVKKDELKTDKEKEEKKPEPKADEKPDAEKDAPKKTTEEDDLTKDLTVENADKRISAAQNKMHTSNKTAKDAIEAQSKLQTQNDELRKIIDEKSTNQPDEKPEDEKTKGIAQAPDEVEKDLEALRIEYPEIGETMIKMMQRQSTENKALKERLDIVDERETKRDAEAKTAKETTHYSAIEEVHPDFKEISQDPLLDEWIDGLPAMEKAGAKAIKNGGETADVIELLTTFKKANGYKVPGVDTDKTAPTKTDSKLDKAKKAVVPQFNKAKEVNTEDKQIRFTQDEIAKWDEKTWAKNEKAVDEAMALGLVR